MSKDNKRNNFSNDEGPSSKQQAEEHSYPEQQLSLNQLQQLSLNQLPLPYATQFMQQQHQMMLPPQQQLMHQLMLQEMRNRHLQQQQLMSQYQQQQLVLQQHQQLLILQQQQQQLQTVSSSAVSSSNRRPALPKLNNSPNSQHMNSPRKQKPKLGNNSTMPFPDINNSISNASVQHRLQPPEDIRSSMTQQRSVDIPDAVVSTDAVVAVDSVTVDSGIVDSASTQPDAIRSTTQTHWLAGESMIGNYPDKIGSNNNTPTTLTINSPDFIEQVVKLFANDNLEVYSYCPSTIITTNYQKN